jgi:hypothetical protein
MTQEAPLTALPPVAKSFHTFCKKCNVDRYHIVLTHTSATAAKIECEVCHSKKTFTLPKAGTSMAKKATVKKGTRKVGVRKNSHADEYGNLMTDRGDEKGVPFNIKTKFTMNQKIDHAKFGPGFVKAVQPDRVDVMFADEVKTLMHNKA